ncbi:MAG: folate-binding protein [Terricaulis sp.]
MAAPLRLDRSLIRVSGPDAANFLNNLLTQDVTLLRQADVQYAALLNPQGKVAADTLLWADGDDCFVIETAPSFGADVVRRLSLYKLRAQISIEDISTTLSALWSPHLFEHARADPRMPDGALGWRRLAPGADAQDGAAAYDAHRLALGIPDLTRDAAPEEVFALEALLEELHGVDFQKGCFVGQENVSRMKRRGTTRRKFCAVRFDGEAPAPGTPVLAGDIAVGTLRSSGSGQAIALLRLDRALAADAALTAAGKPVRLTPPSWLLLPASS